MRTTEMSQAIGVRPRANIHKAVNATLCLLAQRTGCQTRSNRNPSASTETRRILSDFLTVAGVCRKGPRRIPSNNNPANHSTGVFRNHSWGGCATASPDFGAQRRIRVNCSSTPHKLGLYFRPFRGRSAEKARRAADKEVSGHCGNSPPSVYHGCCCG